ncbi:MAG: hypothetical protein ACFCUO_10775 [Rhodospirillales bacterium]
MSSIVRLLPGLIAAIAAFVALKLLLFVDLTSLGFEIVAFFVVYIVVAIAADRAMRAYRDKKS